MSTRESMKATYTAQYTTDTHLEGSKGEESTGNGKSGVLLGAGPGQCIGVSSSTQLQIGRCLAAFGQRELQYNREFPTVHNT